VASRRPKPPKPTYKRTRPVKVLTLGADTHELLAALAEVMDLPVSRVVDLAVRRMYDEERRKP
jgi:hypothetical protein